jgi:serine/threonine protein phosphatase PrpC
VIRNNHCTLCNIGDSRTSIAYRAKTGGVTAVNLTIDHKPDMPAEKVRLPHKMRTFIKYMTHFPFVNVHVCRRG